jgi:hypothetical protein
MHVLKCSMLLSKPKVYKGGQSKDQLNVWELRVSGKNMVRDTRVDLNLGRTERDSDIILNENKWTENGLCIWIWVWEM